MARYAVFLWSQGPRSIYGDVELYFAYASRAIKGEVPYRDYSIEYPIGALPLFLLPRLFARDIEAYRIAFGVEMLLCNAVTVLLVARQVRCSQGLSRVPARLGWYTLFFTSLCPLLLGRYDLAPTAMAFAACYSWNTGRRGLGGILAGVGALTKIFPGVALSPALIVEVYNTKFRRARATEAFLLTAVGLLLLWFLIGRGGLRDSFYVHGRRGLEIESVFAGIVLILSRYFNFRILIIDNFGSSNIYFTYYEILLTIIPALQLGAIFFIAWRFLIRGRGDEFRYATAGLLGFLITGKVLSPQYMIWLLPFIAVLDGRAGMCARPVFMASCLLTRLIYPGPGFLSLLSNRSWAIALLNSRSSLLILLLLILLFDTISDKLVGLARQGRNPQKDEQQRVAPRRSPALRAWFTH